MMSKTFTRRSKTHDRESDTFTVTTSTITGVGIKVRGNPERYKELRLIESEAPTILFVPTTYGDTIRVGDTVEFGGTVYTVRDCNHLAPDGVTIQTRAIVER